MIVKHKEILHSLIPPLIMTNSKHLIILSENIRLYETYITM